MRLVIGARRVLGLAAAIHALGRLVPALLQIEDPEADYRAAMEPLDPVTWLPRGSGRPILLQFADNDRYVPESAAVEIAAAAGSSAETRTYDAEHELSEEVRADRADWLAELLDLPPAT